ncbi:MAG: hypothetical protein O2890_13685 [Cyanobacteria bacterium]|nr:hypothetical protein [Cyanobacteriota bacterium]MDA0867431.1 hypothetical protein [Cyanobacteriota bacterium]
MSPDVAVLTTRIQAELAELALVVERAQRLLAKAIEQNDDDYFDGIALNLHSFYTGAERILEDIARSIDGAVPTGREWHRDLLLQLSAEMGSIRPAVLSRDTRNRLDEYRGLRHVVRNLYAFNLRASRLQELVTDLPKCYEALGQDLTQFCEFLAALDP